MTNLPKHDEEWLPYTHPVMQWVYRLTRPFHMKDNRGAWPFRLPWWQQSGWRVFSVTIGYWRYEQPPGGAETPNVRAWTLLRVEGPGVATRNWKNGLFYFGFHLPFQLSLQVRIPKEFDGERWGWALQASLGWKVTGNLSATFRVQPDLVDHYKVGIQGSAEEGWQHWRTKGLQEGDV